MNFLDEHILSPVECICWSEIYCHRICALALVNYIKYLDKVNKQTNILSQKESVVIYKHHSKFRK